MSDGGLQTPAPRPRTPLRTSRIARRRLDSRWAGRADVRGLLRISRSRWRSPLAYMPQVASYALSKHHHALCEYDRPQDFFKLKVAAPFGSTLGANAGIRRTV